MEHVFLSAGDRELIRAMDRLGGQLATYVQGDALFEAAGVVRTVAKSTTAFRDRSGALRRSIRRGRRGQQIDTPRGQRSIPGARSYVRVGGRGAAHAVFIEYGTIRSRPRPFLKPASLSSVAAQGRAAGVGARRGFARLSRQLQTGRVTARVRRVASIPRF